MIASLFYSCTNSSTIKNPGLIISSNKEIPDDWKLEENQNFSISKSKINTFEKPFLSSKLPGEIQFSQTLTLDSGDYFLMAKYGVNVDKGEFYIKAGSDKGVKIHSSESICRRTIFAIPIKNKKNIKIEFGFVYGSIGDALIDTILIYKVDYKYDLGKRNKIKTKIIVEKLSLRLNQGELLDESVDLFASSINTAFLSKDSLIKQKLVSTYSSEIFKDEYTSYLSTYVNDEKVRNSYCQKSSLSLDELLRLYQIPTRQLHWQKNCSGFHQFLEYWNARDRKWKIIDPYYGIRYVDESGNYLGFEKVEELVRNKKFNSDNIKQMNIGHLYYSESEILEGWMNADLAVHVLNK